MTVYFSGYVFQDDGDALNGATVQLLQVSDAAEEASTTTDSDGFWSFNEADEDQYDVKITSGTSVRYRKWADEISLKMLDVRNNEGNTVPAAVFANHTNNADNDIVHYRGLRGTGADNDEMFFRYYMDDASSNTTEVARMTVKLISASAASEDSEIRWGVAVGGSIVDVLTISNTSSGATDMTMDVAGDINLDADGGDVFFKDDGTTFGSATNNSGNLILKSGTTTAATFSGANVTFAGTVDATTDFTIGTTVITDDVITFTPTTSDTVTMTATTNGAFSLVTVDNAAAAANIQITADGTVDIDSAGVLTLDSGAAINIEPASGSAILLDGTISIDAGVVTGATSITSTAFVGTIDGVVGGNTPAAITGTTIDANTDFTIGDTVITDGVVTDSTGLQLAANLDINGTADISGDVTLSGGADGALQFTNAGENSIKIPDNQASALIIEEANNAYITFVTTNSSEAITVAKATTFSVAATLATGTTIGNLTLANGSITDSGGALDFGNETLTTTGAVDFGGATVDSLTSTGDITTTGQATDWDLVDNNASALSFDASGKTGILDIVTTNSSEGVTMSGTLGVTGTATLATVDIGAGAIDGTAIGASSTSTIKGTTIDATTDFTI